MYKDFFALTEKPFSIVPSAHLFYLSDRHREALQYMVSGLEDGGGFALLTGEVGTGKTSVSRALVSRLTDRTQLATILSPNLSSSDLLASICDALSIGYGENASPKFMTDALYAHLRKNDANGIQTVLIVDEAQHLMPDVLEQLRLLTNLETDQRKLLKVVLIGQPELQHLLAQENLRQLAQRITSRYHLLPLTPAEVANYIRFRLQAVGSLEEVFSDRVITLIARRTCGVPRVINLVCDKSMQLAYCSGQRTVSYRAAELACNEVLSWQQTVDENSTSSGFPLLPVAGAVILALTGALLWPKLNVVWQNHQAQQMAMQQGVTTTLDSTVAQSVASVQNQVSTLVPVPQMVGLREREEAPRIINAPSTMGLGAAPESVEFEAPPVEVAPVVEELPEPESLWAFRNDQRQGLKQLAALWGVSLSFPQSNCDMLASTLLQCASEAASLELVRMMDKPALITLRRGEEKPIHAVIYAVDGQFVELLVNGHRLKATHDWLLEHWEDKVIWLWMPPYTDTVIYSGQQGEPVIWLDKRLSLVLGEAPLETDTLNRVLRGRVSRFQQMQGLSADGIPGPMTLMALQSALQLPGPTLSPQDQRLEPQAEPLAFVPMAALPKTTPLSLTSPKVSELRQADIPVAIAPKPEASSTAAQPPAQPRSVSDDELGELDLSALSPELAERVQAALSETAGQGGEAEEVTSPAEPVVPEEITQSSGEVVPIVDLPAEVQSKLPSMNFQTHIYASTSDARWIKVNDRELWEGDEVAPGLLVEKIGPNHVELGFEGYHFFVPSLSEW
uniref:AAA family ATPase n=1 Tax=Thaumasiovibrio occultus TaxID=1891184 RepID=UPI000B34DDD3|nr:AAA family ATPase [Thaumasiovibrio occultus]